MLPGMEGHQTRFTVANELSRRHFDCAVLLQSALRSSPAGLERANTGSNRRRSRWAGPFTNASDSRTKAETDPRHQRFYYLELLKRAELLPLTRLIRWLHSPARGSSGEGRELFRRSGFEGRVIGVSPGAAFGSAKRWLPERFAQAAGSVARQRGASVAIFGSRRKLSWGRRLHR